VDIPLIDLAQPDTAAVDHALRTSGFLLVTGHGIDPRHTSDLRAAALDFFHGDGKEPYRIPAPGDAGWLPSGAEANAYTLGIETPPDLKESFVLPKTSWVEHPTLAGPARAWVTEAARVADELHDLLARSLGDDHVIAEATTDADHTLSMTWYPPRAEVGEPMPDQWRIGPHTDFGTITLLDRQPGEGGLQVQRADGAWIDAPFEPGALTVNIGDLMARWTGDRWRSTMHRVLPPPAGQPAEELLSLILFVEANLDALIETFPPPIGGGTSYEPVTCGDYLRGRLEAITV
jgi:isopenicillin N synthase-like dioxygenase